MDVNRTVPRWKAAVGLVGFALPGVLILGDALLVPNFMPSDRLSSALLPLSLAFGGMYLWVALGYIPMIATAWNSHAWRTMIKFSFLFLLTPLFGAAIGVMLLAGPVPYLLHVASNPPQITKSATVRKSYAGRRLCRNRITFDNDRAIFRQRLCRQSDDHVDALRNGGSVVLTGTESANGFLVQEVQLVSVNTMPQHE